MINKELAERIPGGVKWGNDGEGICRCPFHDDRNPSCSINIQKETFYCHACGEKGTLRQLLEHCRISVPSTFEEQTPYDYRDADGVLRYQSVRYYKNGVKGFYCRRPDGAGGWITKGAMKNITPLPYRLGDVQKAILTGEPIFICEGEKDCDKLASLWLIATTNHGGAGKWRSAHAKYLTGAKVILCGDCDIPGQKHMQQVGRSLLGLATEIKVLSLGYPIKKDHGKDVSDFLTEHNQEVFEQAVAMAGEFVSAEEKEDSKEATPADLLEFTDLANAARFFREYGDQVRYCTVAKSWLYWDGKVWAEDDNQIIAGWAKTTAKELYEEAWALSDAAIARKAIACKSRAKIESMLALSKSEGQIPVRPNELDTDPWLWNCDNGMMDLKNIGFLLPHDQKKLITRISPVSFDDGAKCPKWDAFLLEIMSGDQKMVDFLRRMIGYCLTGDMRERKYFTLYGGGNNGKTVFIEIVMEVFGAYAATALRDTFLRRKSENIQHDIARLRGARLVCVSETGKGSYLDEELVKQWTGGDTLSGRFLYAKKAFDFRPVGKLLIRTNYRPNIAGQDEGIWGRSLFVEFGERFEGEREDKELKGKLLTELPGIFRWCLVGCAQWLSQGLDPPEKIQASGKEYREDSDPLSEFFSGFLVQIPDAKIYNDRLYTLYQKCCEDTGEKKPWTASWLGRELRSRGFKKDQDSQGRFWTGLGEK
ncbi:MAG TPA: phage/plasmid primase, P4 family [Spirochaetia bacterium]|nr:phage/plasmid primase, P4 family [Spirochaetia bacterium]